MALCGANNKSGGKCKGPAMANGRCRMHGGKTPKTNGPKPGTRTALKHGIYSQALLPGEESIWESIELGKLDDDIKIARIQLRRALLAQKTQGEELEAFEEKEMVAGAEGGSNGIERKKRRVDYDEKINRLLGRIGDLESKRTVIMQAISGDEEGSKLDPVSVTVHVTDARKRDADA